MSRYCDHTTNNSICSVCFGKSDRAELIQENIRLHGVITKRDDTILGQHALLLNMQEAVRLARVLVSKKDIDDAVLVELREALSQVGET